MLVPSPTVSSESKKAASGTIQDNSCPLRPFVLPSVPRLLFRLRILLPSEFVSGSLPGQAPILTRALSEAFSMAISESPRVCPRFRPRFQTPEPLLVHRRGLPRFSPGLLRFPAGCHFRLSESPLFPRNFPITIPAASRKWSSARSDLLRVSFSSENIARKKGQCPPASNSVAGRPPVRQKKPCQTASAAWSPLAPTPCRNPRHSDLTREEPRRGLYIVRRETVLSSKGSVDR